MPLTPHVRNYGWGSKTLIPNFMGWQASREPIAELWFGAHNSGSSRVNLDDAALSEVIRANPREILGEAIIRHFGARLPFMLKVIAVEQPLSIQVHPNLVQAQRGQQHAPQLYADEFAKPEQLIALSSMRVLHGFRHMGQVVALFEKLECSKILKSLSSSSVCATFLKLLKGEFDSEYSNILDSTVFEESTLVQSLSTRFPNDRAVVAPYFLNLVKLAPGESIIINPGEVHAYLSGLGTEVLGNSDNVLRAGLTDKVKSLEEFENIVSPISTDVAIKTPVLNDLYWWESRHVEFKVGVYKPDCSLVSVHGPAIVLTTDGQLRATSKLENLNFTKGEVFFIKGGAQVTLEGDAQAYVCTANIQQ